jgi:hypothetical protein
MGLDGVNGKVIESLDVSKSKGRKKKKLQDRVMEDEENETGCWHSFRFIGGCISSRSKVDSSVSGTSTNYGNLYFLSTITVLMFLEVFLLFFGIYCSYRAFVC